MYQTIAKWVAQQVQEDQFDRLRDLDVTLTFQVAHNFYFKFLPELMHLAEEKGMTEKYEKVVGEILAKPEHAWYKEGFDADVMKAIQAEQKDRYKQ